MARPELKKHWIPSEGAFRRFLDWLDEGADSGGERYLEIRRRLELYFERRNCVAPEELADETLTRAARRLEEEGTIRTPSPAHFCFVLAKLVLYESLRAAKQTDRFDPDDSAAIRRLRLLAVGHEPSDDTVLSRLEHCLDTLDAADRELILEYYHGDHRAKIDGRRSLAARLGISTNALSIRACRLRERLEACVKAGVPAEVFRDDSSYRGRP